MYRGVIVRIRFAVSIALVAALASCQAVPTQGPGTPRKTAGASPPAASPATPASPPSTASTANVTPGTTLHPLTGQVARLTGQVLLGALYATQQGGANRLIGQDGSSFAGMNDAHLIGNAGGTLIGNAGGTLIGNAGGTLIGNAGGTIISNDGSTLVDASGRIVAQGGGNVIVASALIGNDGSTLIGQDGSSLIAQDGSSLIGQDGSGVVSHDGGTLVSQDGGSLIGNAGGTLKSIARRYLLADTPAAAPGYGDMWPAAGMWVSAVDERTGFTVPLGKDDKGKDVYAVYSDAHGQFDVSVPSAYADHVRIVARAPGRHDPRLVLNVLSKASGDAKVVGEDQDSASEYLRYGVAQAVLNFMGYSLDDASTAMPTTDAGNSLLGAAAGPLKAVGGKLIAALSAMDFAHLPVQRRQEVGYLIADALIARSGVESAPLQATQAFTNYPLHIWDPTATQAMGSNSPPTVLDGAQKALSDLREAAAKVMESPGYTEDYFTKKPYVVAANLRRPVDRPVHFAKPSDLTRFMLHEYALSPREGWARLAVEVMRDLGLPPGDFDRLNMAFQTILQTMLNTVGTTDAQGHTVVDDLADLAGSTGAKIAKVPVVQTPAAGPSAEPVVLPVRPTAPTVDVKTVATLPPGVNSPKLGDAAFTVAILADPKANGTVLYVADIDGCVVRRVTVAKDGSAQVAVVAGQQNQPGVATGDGKQACFSSPSGLAFDAQGRLYVSDVGLNQIRRVTFAPDGSSTVDVVAGDPSGIGHVQDGGYPAELASPIAAMSAHLQRPGGLSFDAAGTLYFTDQGNHAIRKVQFGASGATVSTALHGIIGRFSGSLSDPNTGTDTPSDVKVTADGSLVYTDTADSSLSLMERPDAPDGQARLLAGGALPTPGQDGFWGEATFNYPNALALDAQGRLVVADTRDNLIRRVDTAGWVVTLAGATTAGNTDGAGPSARFDEPRGVTVANDGAIYVFDTGNRAIKQIREH